MNKYIEELNNKLLLLEIEIASLFKYVVRDKEKDLIKWVNECEIAKNEIIKKLNESESEK